MAARICPAREKRVDSARRAPPAELVRQHSFEPAAHVRLVVADRYFQHDRILPLFRSNGNDAQTLLGRRLLIWKRR